MVALVNSHDAAPVGSARGRASAPTVSIGLPVYNGERYLEDALDAILAQTFTDFELVVCDNASSDGTEGICRRYAEKDPRIQYHRNTQTVGGAENGNITFRLSRGKYFRLAAHDDLIEPTLLERCVEALEADPEVVLCYPWNYIIDENGATTGKVARGSRPDVPRWKRFIEISRSVTDCEEIYGVMRSSAMAATGLQRSYTDSDRTLLANLALLGEFAEVPEYLFLKRLHPGNSTAVMPDWRQRMQWFGATGGAAVMPHVLQLLDYVRIITGAPISTRHKLRCYVSMIGWMATGRRWGCLIKDLLLGLRVGVVRGARALRITPA